MRAITRVRLGFCAAWRALDVCGAIPFGECGGVCAELVAHDGVELTHECDAARDGGLYGLRGRDARAETLVLTGNALVEVVDERAQVFMECGRKLVPNKFGLVRFGIRQECARGAQKRLVAVAARQTKQLVKAGYVDGYGPRGAVPSF